MLASLRFASTLLPLIYISLSHDQNYYFQSTCFLVSIIGKLFRDHHLILRFILYSFHYDSGDMCREALLSFLTSGDDVLVLGSLGVLATLLQTKGYLADIWLTSPLFYFCLLTEYFLLQNWMNQCQMLLEFFLSANSIRNSYWYLSSIKN